MKTDFSAHSAKFMSSIHHYWINFLHKYSKKGQTKYVQLIVVVVAAVVTVLAVEEVVGVILSVDHNLNKKCEWRCLPHPLPKLLEISVKIPWNLFSMKAGG